MEHFRSENHMQGKAGVMLCLFALPFIGGGFLFGSFIPRATRYTWPAVFHLAFVALGLAVVGTAIYGVIRKVSFYTHVDDKAIEWGRFGLPIPTGRLEIDELQKVVYAEGMEAGFHLILIDKSGKGHELPGEFLYSDSEAKRLLSFLRQHRPNIEIVGTKT